MWKGNVVLHQQAVIVLQVQTQHYTGKVLSFPVPSQIMSLSISHLGVYPAPMESLCVLKQPARPITLGIVIYF